MTAVRRDDAQLGLGLGWEETREEAGATPPSADPGGDEGRPADGTGGLRPAPGARQPGGEGGSTGRRRDIEQASVLVRSLARTSKDHPFDRKLIVCRTGGEGRELLRQLGLRTGAWVGFEAVTPRNLAITLAAPALAGRGVRLTDVFDEEALLDEAIDKVLLDGAHAHLARGAGMRRAIAHAIQALRGAGVDVGTLRRVRLETPSKNRILAGILENYEDLLRERRLADGAEVFVEAARVLEKAGPGAGLAQARVYVAPGIRRQGVVGGFLRALMNLGGTHVLATDPVRGLIPPDSLVWSTVPNPVGRFSYLHDVDRAPAGGADHGGPGTSPAASLPRRRVPSVRSSTAEELDVFAANSIDAELREVMRRARARGLGWDEVEIVATDPVVYGSALHALAERLHVPVCFASGLPVERTRPGRVAQAYFRWIEGGFQAGVIHTLLYANDLAAPRPNHRIRGVTLAKSLRRLRIGWGRERYLPALDRALQDSDELAARKYETPKQLEKRKGWTRRRYQALRDLLAPVLRAIPPVPTGTDSGAFPVSPARVARGLRRFLARTSPGSEVDDTARLRLERILRRFEAMLTRPTDYRAAAATVRRHLEIRVPAPRAEGSAPWSSAGGALHLADIESGGRTGRRATFIVGLDAQRLGGQVLQDPFLLDTDRARLAAFDLRRSSDHMRERRFQLAALLARLRGSVELSYSAWDPAEARAVAPSAELLQAFRLMRNDSAATFEDLERYTRHRAGLAPRRGVRLDGADVWMSALETDGRLLRGEEAVQEAFPRIGAGVRAQAALAGDVVTSFHGRIRPRSELDPRVNRERSVSASALSALGACAKRYFYAYVLWTKPPDDPEYDPERWLDALRRGQVLHRVYERALNESREKGIGAHEKQFHALVKAILRQEVARIVRDIPSPNKVVRAREEEDLARDAELFVAMIRRDNPEHIATELRFGVQGKDPAPFRTSSGPVQVRGAIDRVDRLPGGLRVVDYKTGSTFGFGAKDGIYRGGRRLQHAIYAAAASYLYDEPTVAMEYHFPTRKGRNRTIPYRPRDLADAPRLVSRLLDLVARGHFLPTDNPDDCRFCDYQAICRVTNTEYSLTSPLAEWVRQRRDDMEEFRGLRRIRSWEQEDRR